MSGLKKRPLGKTGLEVTEIGLGTVFLSEIAGTQRDEAIRVVHRALELGINYIDTAPLYGDAHEVLGEALEGRGEDYIFGTKCGRWDYKTGPYRSLDAFKKQFEVSLKGLRRESVDILYIHECDWYPYWEDVDEPREVPNIKIEGTYDYDSAPVFKFLEWAKTQGLTRYLGMSGNNAHLVAKVLNEIGIEIDVVVIAFQYSLIWRNAVEDFIPSAKEKDVGVVLGAPLQQGRLAVPRQEWINDPPAWMDDDTRDRFSRLYEIQRESGLTLAELAMRFLLSDQDIDCIIPGAANVTQLEENVNCSIAGPLALDLHQSLDKIGKVFPGLYKP